MPIKGYDFPSVEIRFISEESVHFHNDIELLYLLEGTALAEVGEETTRMKKEDLLVVNSNKPYRLKAENETILCKLSIPRRMICEHTGYDFFLIRCNSAMDRGADYSNILRILREIVRHDILSGNKADLYYQGMVFQLVYYLVEHFLINGNDARYQKEESRTGERMQQILSYIHENYNKPITLNELAGKLYLTNSYLSRFLKKNLDMNFVDYLNGVRLHYAVDDLIYTTKSMTRIAMDNGFSNISTFNRTFRNAYNMPPGKYKESMHTEHEKRKVYTNQAKVQLKQSLSDYTALPAREAPQKTSVISVDASCKENLLKPWNKLLNIGEMYALRDYRIRADILRLKSSLNFTGVRFWNILCTKMHTGAFISDDSRDYNFTYVDECIDFLLQNRIQPFFQMGYKSLRINHDEPIVIQHHFSFRTLEEYIRTLHVFLVHLLRRYGADEVNKWYFEVWQPNSYYRLPEGWGGEFGEKYAIAVYRKLREMLPEATIGGVEYSHIYDRERMRKEMLTYKKANVDFDFISCVSYPYHQVGNRHEGSSKWLPDANFMSNEVQTLRGIMAETGNENKPVWMTEYNLTISHRNLLNDTCFKGAYVLKSMIDIAGEADVAGYWLMSDIHSEGETTNKILYGGNGLLTKDGIFKPAYFALYFLAQSKAYLVEKSGNHIVTTDGYGTYTVIIHNMQFINHYAFLKKEESITLEDLDKAFDSEAAKSFELRLEHVKCEQYRMKRFLVDKNHGSIIELWKRNWQVSVLKNDEIAYIKNVCTPDMLIQMLNTDKNGRLVIRDSIEVNGFLLYELEPL